MTQKMIWSCQRWRRRGLKRKRRGGAEEVASEDAGRSHLKQQHRQQVGRQCSQVVLVGQGH
jgi:DNA-binding transcriptional regulator/RsmH inhibitor MraZ